MNRLTLETWEFKSPGYDEAHARYQERERRARKWWVAISTAIATATVICLLIKG